MHIKPHKHKETETDHSYVTHTHTRTIEKSETSHGKFVHNFLLLESVISGDDDWSCRDKELKWRTMGKANSREGRHLTVVYTQCDVKYVPVVSMNPLFKVSLRLLITFVTFTLFYIIFTIPKVTKYLKIL